MFVNRGMVEAAAGEGEVVGVMAHELSHVLLRHGTANATKAQGIQLGQVAGAIAGAVVGGGWGQVISQGSQFGLGTCAHEVQPRVREAGGPARRADHGARRLRSPRSRTHVRDDPEAEWQRGAAVVEQPPRSGQPVGVHRQRSGAAADRDRARDQCCSFQQARAAFAQLPPAKSMAELARNTPRSGGSEGGTATDLGGPRRRPSAGARRPSTARCRAAVSSRRRFRPTGRAVASNSAVKYVPQNGYGPANGESVFTHGVELGVARASSRDLGEATETLLRAFAQNNPELRRAGDAREITMARRGGLAVPLVNRSALGGSSRSASIRRFSPTAISSTTPRSSPSAKPTSTGSCSIASADRSGFETDASRRPSARARVPRRHSIIAASR